MNRKLKHRSKPNLVRRLVVLFYMIKKLMSLKVDTNEIETIQYIKNNVNFKSGNAWTLVFAILIASVGLNINSTSIIIGAMLISPIMGPIIGAGFALGTNDFQLLSRSWKNLLMAVIISIVTSMIYFLLSPLTQVESELLARIHPTVYDVLIAIFGGMAGIIALSRNEKGNVIPGVAIATALMPPLCTAGFGLANGHIGYFLGAMYLFIINSVFICLSTYIFVRYLGFAKVTYLEKGKEAKMNRVMIIVASSVFIPSVFLAWMFLSEASFKTKAMQFIKSEVHFPDTFILDKQIEYGVKKQKIVISLFGSTISDDKINNLRVLLTKYDLEKTELVINQSLLARELESKMKADKGLVTSEVDKARIQLASTQNQLNKFTQSLEITDKLQRELKPLFPKISDIIVTTIKRADDVKLKNIESKIINKAKDAKLDLEVYESVLIKIAFVKWKRRPLDSEKNSLKSFLRERLEDKDLEVQDIIE